MPARTSKRVELRMLERGLCLRLIEFALRDGELRLDRLVRETRRACFSISQQAVNSLAEICDFFELDGPR